MEAATLRHSDESLFSEFLLHPQDRTPSHAELFSGCLQREVKAAVVPAVVVTAQLDVVLDCGPREGSPSVTRKKAVA